MSYQALYRAYRPNTFDKVVGQEAVVKTLQNAIINNKISHAYLFCGPRGTGKTSLARIFAKALNCLHVQKNGEPCCECHVCKEIDDSSSPDVIEIDAASNNGVDEIRDIKERVKFLPSGAKYKIYIIDEVHMLSAGAFNALLKTLEEPPKHVIFVLATTEPQKLPATIISRCQRYDFKPFNIEEISNNLKSICAKENVTITDEAAQLISEVADGGMRDALSILDQTISYGNKDITIDDVNTITGSINNEVMCNLMSFIDSKDTNNALSIINELIKDGKEVSKIINGMLLYCRDLMLYKSVGSKDLNKFIFEKEKFQTLALKIANTKIIYFIELLCDIQNKIKYSSSPAIYLEIAVIRMSSINNEELDVIKRMDELETKMLDTNFSAEASASNVDIEKVNSLDNRLNKVIEELSKFELPNLSKKVNDIEQIVADKINQDLVNSAKQNEMQKLTELQSDVSSKFIEIEAKLNALENGKTISTENESESSNMVNPQIAGDIVDIKKEINDLKKSIANVNSNNNNDYAEQINELKNQISVSMNNTPSVDEDSLKVFDEKIINFENRLNEIQNAINSNKIEETASNYNDEEINNIKNNLQKMSSKINDIQVAIDEINLTDNNETEIIANEDAVDNEKISDLDEKLKQLEKTVYELMAEKLAVKEKADKPKVVKKPAGQTNIFDFGVPAVEGLNANFDELEKEESDNDLVENNDVKLVEVSNTVEEENTIEKYEEKEETHEAIINDNDSAKQTEDQPTLFDDIKPEDVQEELDTKINEPQPTLFDFDKPDNVDAKIDNSEELVAESNIKVGLFDDTENEVINEAVTDQNNDEKEVEQINNIINKVQEENKVDAQDNLSDIDFKPEEEIKPVKNEIINQYYDDENHLEVINKTNSSIVIRNDKAEEQNVNNNEQKEIIVLDEPDGPDKFAKYNIEDLEKLLYDAQESNAKNDKARVLGIWANLTRGIDPNMYSVAQILSEAKIEAVGDRELVITYESVSQCNEVMRWSFKEQALRLLFAKLGATYNYLALPLNIWKDKRREYIEQYQMGIKKAKLTPIIIRGLNVNDIEEKNDDVKDEKIDQTLKLFGEDVVKVK